MTPNQAPTATVMIQAAALEGSALLLSLSYMEPTMYSCQPIRAAAPHLSLSATKRRLA